MEKEHKGEKEGKLFCLSWHGSQTHDRYVVTWQGREPRMLANPQSVGESTTRKERMIKRRSYTFLNNLKSRQMFKVYSIDSVNHCARGGDSGEKKYTIPLKD